MGILLGAFRQLKNAEKEVDDYANECSTTEPDIMVWELTTEEVDKPLSTKFNCLKIKKM